MGDEFYFFWSNLVDLNQWCATLEAVAPKKVCMSQLRSRMSQGLICVANSGGFAYVEHQTTKIPSTECDEMARGTCIPFP